MKTTGTSDFTTTLLVDQTPEKVFEAINNVHGWWTENLEGNAQKLDNEFTVTFGETFITMKVVELVPVHKIVWLVTDCYKHWLTHNKTEWNGTKISFEISKKDKQTEIRFTHLGLVPKMECYGGCSNAWTEYIGGSLNNLIVTGKGEPTAKERKTNSTK